MFIERQPKNTFPNELIKKCQKVISGYSGKKFTEDEAELYLDKFAKLMNVTVKIVDQIKDKKVKK